MSPPPPLPSLPLLPSPPPLPTSPLPPLLLSHNHTSYHSVFRLVCRVYASIADVLGYMAGEGGGIRAGPASNVAWGRAFALLDAAVKVLIYFCTYVRMHTMHTYTHCRSVHPTVRIRHTVVKGRRSLVLFVQFVYLCQIRNTSCATLHWKKTKIEYYCVMTTLCILYSGNILWKKIYAISFKIEDFMANIL